MPPNPKPMPPPTWMPSGARSLRIDVRKAMIPISLGVLAILYFVLGVSLAIVAVLTLVVPGLYIGSAVYVRRQAPKFEAEFNRLLQAGDIKGLTAHYRGARLLRILAPEHWMLSRLGLILLLRGQHREAEGILEEAWEMAPKGWRQHLLGPLSRVKYELGEWEDLRALAEQWRQRSLFAGSANIYLAAALMERDPPQLERARELVDEARGSLGTSERALCEKVAAKIEQRAVQA